MPKFDKIEIKIWTEHFLGTSAKCTDLLDLLETMDGSQWVPDRWSDCEPVRSVYSREAYPSILSTWTAERGGRVSHEMFFRMKKPFAEVWVSSWRSKVPSLNSVSVSFEAKAFSSDQGVDRLKSIILGLVNWSEAVYATAWHTQQAHRRWAQFTPLERLERLDWLTFFGMPYVRLFGGEQRVLATPGFSAQRVSNGVLLLAAPHPDSPEIISSDQTLIVLEKYLGADAFAGENFPEVHCRVPTFDLSETITEKMSDECSGPVPFEPVVLTDPTTETASAVVVLTPSSNSVTRK